VNAVSLFAGCGGLDLGLPGDTAVMVENSAACRLVLAYRFPAIPIVEDVRDVEQIRAALADAERERRAEGRTESERRQGQSLPVGDSAPALLTAGFPCQPFSHAGRRRGAADDRYLWPETIAAVRALRPRRVFLENVPGLLTIRFDSGEPVFGRVLTDLAEAGYVGRWVCVRSSDAGAPHRRERVFVFAADAESNEGRLGHGDDAGARGIQNGCEPAAGRDASTHADGEGREGTQPAERRDLSAGSGRWGVYWPAVDRWQRTIGRPAPPPVDKRGRLNPRLPEWMLGLPDGWVTDVPDVTRTAQLRILGNAVQPQAAALAWRLLTVVL
jgi:DNA (cytosine-5)-methyltransferase 1